MYAEHFALPGEDEADYLLAGLANLIRQRGVETFVSAPILLAEPRFFPDAVEARARGASVLLRRLLAYAGLEPTRLDIELFGDVERGQVAGDEEAHDHVAAWFMDIDRGVYRYGLLQRLGLPPAARWPLPHTLEQKLAELPDAEVSIHDQPALERKQAELEQVAFRVLANQARLAMVVGLAVGFCSAWMLELRAAFWPWGLGLGALGWLTGGRLEAFVCSGCSHQVRVAASRCHFCSLPLVGDIREPAERFAAEDRYRAEQRASHRGPDDAVD